MCDLMQHCWGGGRVKSTLKHEMQADVQVTVSSLSGAQAACCTYFLHSKALIERGKYLTASVPQCGSKANSGVWVEKSVLFRCFLSDVTSGTDGHHVFSQFVQMQRLVFQIVFDLRECVWFIQLLKSRRQHFPVRSCCFFTYMSNFYYYYFIFFYKIRFIFRPFFFAIFPHFWSMFVPNKGLMDSATCISGTVFHFALMWDTWDGLLLDT